MKKLLERETIEKRQAIEKGLDEALNVIKEYKNYTKEEENDIKILLTPNGEIVVWEFFEEVGWNRSIIVEIIDNEFRLTYSLIERTFIRPEEWESVFLRTLEKELSFLKNYLIEVPECNIYYIEEENINGLALTFFASKLNQYEINNQGMKNLKIYFHKECKSVEEAIEEVDLLRENQLYHVYTSLEDGSIDFYTSHIREEVMPDRYNKHKLLYITEDIKEVRRDIKYGNIDKENMNIVEVIEYGKKVQEGLETVLERVRKYNIDIKEKEEELTIQINPDKEITILSKEIDSIKNNWQKQIKIKLVDNEFKIINEESPLERTKELEEELLFIVEMYLSFIKKL